MAILQGLGRRFKRINNEDLAATGKSVWQLIKADIDRYRVTDKRSYLGVFILSPGPLTSVIFRISHWVWAYKGALWPLVVLLRPILIILNRFCEIFAGISIRPQAVIGEGLYINHGSSVYISGDAVIGRHCNISHEVTIGVGGRDLQRGVPRLGNRVFIGPGAKLFGSIVIGDDVAIGANTVVTHSIPDRAVAAGIPAKVVSMKGSFEYVLYRGMESDEARTANLRISMEESQSGTIA